MIRDALEQDVELLTRIAFAAKGHWGYPPEWLELWRDELVIDVDTLASCSVWVATVDDRPAATIGLSWDDVPEVEFLWVDPAFIGRGLGSALIDHARAAARDRGVATLKVVADPNAVGFYERQGAVRVGSEPSTPAGRVLPVYDLRT